ncbi:MAG: ATP/GTP-binding protein [Candidatus Hermodarchaeota archaeon]
MIYDFENKIIQVKVVYYGPAMSGKTTSLKYLFSLFGKKGNLSSIESSVGRTLFFDFGVLQFQGTGWGLKFLMYTATGQDFYAGTRPATLNGVDGIIFVADSQIKFLEDNLRSWNELKTLFGIEFHNIPIVIALNKSDLNNGNKLKKDQFMNLIEFEKFRAITLHDSVATRGTGVLESFTQLISFLFPQLKISIKSAN